MTKTHPPELIKLLAHDLRWALVKSLTESDYRVNELVSHVGQPVNLVSYHLKKLRDDALVTARRSEADRRDTYYSLELDHLRDLYWAVGADLHPALTPDQNTAPAAQKTLHQPVSVLFVCTHNSARSQMAEGLMQHLSDGQVNVHSAGSYPTGVHPEAIRAMDALDIDIRPQESQHFDDFQGQSFDFVITVCDLAREVCPTFPGEGKQIHWGFPDPAKVADETQRQAAFMRTAQRLKSRINHFLHSLETER